MGICAIAIKLFAPNTAQYYFFNIRPLDNETVETTNVYQPRTKFTEPLFLVRLPQPPEWTAPLNGIPLRYKVMRHTGLHHSVSFIQTMYLEDQYIQTGDNIIPIVRFGHAFDALPHTYYELRKGEASIETIQDYTYNVDLDKAYAHLRPKKQEPAPALPSHVWKSMMEGALYRKETCPVSFEELTIGNICILPCMHCFDVGSFSSSTKDCPLCRAAFDIEKIIKYRDLA